MIDMRYDKNGLPVNEYYTEELIKPTIDKKKALENQKYYIGASILLLFIVLIKRRKKDRELIEREEENLSNNF